MASSRRRSKNRTFLIGQSPPRRGLASASSGQYTCRSLSCCNVTSGEALVFSELDYLYLGKIFPDKADGVVGRTIIDQDDLAISIALVRKSTQAIFKKSLTIPVNNDNANLTVLFSRNHPTPTWSNRLCQAFLSNGSICS